MKTILMGTPGFVVPIFDKVAGAHEVVAVFTRAPKPAGRKKVLTKTPVHEWAEAKGIPVYTSIKSFDDVAAGQEERLQIIVAAYGVILRENVLRFDPINIHPSDLPKYRGPAPMITAIMNGDVASAVCLMKMTAEVDAGAVLMRRAFAIGPDDTTEDVEQRVAEIAGPMVIEYLDAPEKFPPMPQVGEPSFSRKVEKSDLEIDWSKSAAAIHNQVRAIGGRATINGVDVKIISTRVENGALKILELQPAGKRVMSAKDFENGYGKIQIDS
ncbi:MAG: hypothetical protein LBL46_04580 [Rickettsiales bacterium]|jgi:methionyl-tRNA formyltransferase|nr:hypothetical protein [Rickettsiales bacterium]